MDFLSRNRGNKRSHNNEYDSLEPSTSTASNEEELKKLHYIARNKLRVLRSIERFPYSQPFQRFIISTRFPTPALNNFLFANITSSTATPNAAATPYFDLILPPNFWTDARKRCIEQSSTSQYMHIRQIKALKTLPINRQLSPTTGANVLNGISFICVDKNGSKLLSTDLYQWPSGYNYFTTLGNTNNSSSSQQLGLLQANLGSSLTSKLSLSTFPYITSGTTEANTAVNAQTEGFNEVTMYLLPNNSQGTYITMQTAGTGIYNGQNLITWIARETTGNAVFYYRAHSTLQNIINSLDEQFPRTSINSLSPTDATALNALTSNQCDTPFEFTVQIDFPEILEETPTLINNSTLNISSNTAQNTSYGSTYAFFTLQGHYGRTYSYIAGESSGSAVNGRALKRNILGIAPNTQAGSRAQQIQRMDEYESSDRLEGVTVHDRNQPVQAYRANGMKIAISDVNGRFAHMSLADYTYIMEIDFVFM
jgi:hypothetical protein